MIIQPISDTLRIFRDDMYPFLGGGNKGRKIRSIEEDIIKKGANAIVTTGGIQSNHCRATALCAAQNGWECTLVLHGSRKSFEAQTGNARIMRLSGARIVFAGPQDIGAEMDKAMEAYRMAGRNPYYIWGGGHTMEGGHAYIEAVAELKKICDEQGWHPHRIFLASGTGSTQAGILAGLDKYGLDCRVTGISVARKAEMAEKVVAEFYQDLCSHYGIKTTGRKAEVLDTYLCGGYEQYNETLLELSLAAIKKYGFVLDTTYSGKAFYGMQDCINNSKENILFWHTGGLFNFLASEI